MKFGVHIFCVRASSFNCFKILGRNLNLTRVVNDINITSKFSSFLNRINITVTLCE